MLVTLVNGQRATKDTQKVPVVHTKSNKVYTSFYILDWDLSAQRFARR